MPAYGWVTAAQAAGRCALLLVAAALASAALAAAAFGANAGGSPGNSPSATSASSFDYPLGGPSRAVERGSRVGTACRFTSVLTLAPNQTSLEERDVSVDVDSCTRVIERGTPPAAATSEQFEHRQGETTDSGGIGSRATAAKARHRARAAFNASPDQVWGEARWEDPLNIDVNRVRNTAYWEHYNGCVHSPWAATWDQSWYSTSGWFRVATDFDGRAQCSYVRSSSYAGFRNNSFCATISTYAYYDRNTLHGYPDGEANHILTTYVEGGCIALLHGSRTIHRDF